MTPDEPKAYPRAASRAWMELSVRPWLAVTTLMLLAAIGIGIYNFLSVREERNIIATGTAADATVVSLGRDTRQLPRDEPVRVKLEYTDPKSGRLIQSERMIHRQHGGVIRLKEIVPIRFDPASPEVWTARTEPTPILQSMTVPMALIPVVIASLAVTWWQRARVLRVVRRGQRETATITSVKQPPLAPLSKQLGVTRDTDRTVRQLYWPTRLGPVAKGDTIDVLTEGKLIVAAKAYE
jgi:hypothetical protein